MYTCPADLSFVSQSRRALEAERESLEQQRDKARRQAAKLKADLEVRAFDSDPISLFLRRSHFEFRAVSAVPF